MASALRAVEFYSGIGGMHFALKSCGISVNVVAAIDINTTANDVYAHNFPETPLLNRNIQGIKLEEFIKFNADIFAMSPPCQPFTRQGNQKASEDPRTRSFLYIMNVIRSLPKRPSYILMENVKGFEVSETREEFIKTLRDTHYDFQEFLLSPTQFGIPNSRLRYFLVAVHRPFQLPFSKNDCIMENFPASLNVNTNIRPCSRLSTDNPRSHCPICNKLNSEPEKSTDLTSNKTRNITLNRSSVEQEEQLQSKAEYNNVIPDCSLNDISNKENEQYANTSDESTSLVSNISVQNSITEKRGDLKADSCQQTSDNCDKDWNKINNIQQYLEEGRNNFEEFLVPDNILKKKVLLMDIVLEKCNHSCCFTKGYGHYVEGTGSVLQMSSMDSSSTFKKYSDATEDDKIRLLAPLGLRYFTPREIANILSFPKHFEFPPTVTRKQKYRLLGNSLNVLVVSELMKILFSSERKKT